MTGDELYERFMAAWNKKNTLVDAWYDLDIAEREVYEEVAEGITTDENIATIEGYGNGYEDGFQHGKSEAEEPDGE